MITNEIEDIFIYKVIVTKNKVHKIMGFTHTPSGTTFENRKQACQVMGQCRYRKALKNGEFSFSVYYKRK